MARFEYKITIDGADNGFIVQAGCKNLVFADKDVPTMMGDIERYITGGNKGRLEMIKKYFPDMLEEKNEYPNMPPTVGTRAGLGQGLFEPAPTPVLHPNPNY
ncbi:hypothetical protein UFOVP1138_14 [uncultured Caudovirales phage]|uniref:Uncharacterized protein n=1 Tax=uncultured Caudovirales phage TaxID=2100421 RepID=A0A6J5S7H4_9CAUD|nr:hypothetical protein UFOVP975_17 [uncultured Caudovirales phage]CAB4186166.1 hypothetical protein UFOVP1138_14 [uncultured Caudovirales phage]CAB4204391.1 hypothetical protein UFOVP1394_11 [uncultured Caudovirales phage]